MSAGAKDRSHYHKQAANCQLVKGWVGRLLEAKFYRPFGPEVRTDLKIIENVRFGHQRETFLKL